MDLINFITARPLLGLVFSCLFAVTAVAQDTSLSPRAKARDKNNNGLIERTEAGGPLKDNFDTMDCDKNGGLDGREIRGFFTGAGCPNRAPRRGTKTTTI
jgi:hypothetical protein